MTRNGLKYIPPIKMPMTRGWCKWHCFAHITVICTLQIIYCRHLPSPVVDHCCNPNCPTAKWSLFPYGIAFHSGFRLHRARGSPNLAPSGGTVKQLVVTGTSAFVAMLTLQDTHRSWIIYLYMSVCAYYQVFYIPNIPKIWCVPASNC